MSRFGLSFSNDDADNNDIFTSSAVSIFHAIIRICSGRLLQVKFSIWKQTKKKHQSLEKEGKSHGQVFLVG